MWISQGNSFVNKVCKSVTVKKLGSLCKKSLDTDSCFTCDQQHHSMTHWYLTSKSPRKFLGSLDPFGISSMPWLKTPTKKLKKEQEQGTRKVKNLEGFWAFLEKSKLTLLGWVISYPSRPCSSLCKTKLMGTIASSKQLSGFPSTLKSYRNTACFPPKEFENDQHSKVT
jgi:hypothetical protein